MEPLPDVKICLPKEGVYRCEVVVEKNGTGIKKRMTTLAFFTQKTREAFTHFMESSLIPDERRPRFYDFQYPFTDFALIKGPTADSMKLCEKYGFEIRKMKKHSAVLVSKVPFSTRGGADILFSGSAVVEGKLIYGSNDLCNVPLSEELYDRVGCYTAIVDTGNTLEFINDYFGLGQFYYYKDEEAFIISNRYQLLLMCLKDLGKKPRVRYEYVVCSLAAHSAWNNYPISQKMLFENMYVVDVGKRVKIQGDEILFAETEIAEVFHHTEEISDCEYEKMLMAAKREIQQNISACLNSEHFQNYSMDLTGGIDSRIAFAVATNIPEAHEKIKIYSARKKTDDFYIPLSMADTYNFDYDIRRIRRGSAVSKENARCSMDDLLEQRISINMGKSIDPVLTFYNLGKVEKTLVFTGGCGEIISRPYITSCIYGRKVNTVRFNQNPGELFNDISNYIGQSYLIDYENGGKYFEQEFFDSLESIDYGSSYYEKLEYLYLLRRNRYHFSLSRDGGYMYPLFAPNMSKAAFKALHSHFCKQQGLSNAFHLMSILNPVIASFDYDLPMYNDSKKRYGSQEYIDEPFLKNMKMSISHNTKRFDDQMELFEFEDETPDETAAVLYSSFTNVKDINLYLRNKILPYFKRLMLYQNGIFRDTLGAPLYYFLTSYFEEDRSEDYVIKMKAIYQKCTNIVSQINMIYEDEGQ